MLLRMLTVFAYESPGITRMDTERQRKKICHIEQGVMSYKNFSFATTHRGRDYIDPRGQAPDHDRAFRGPQAAAYALIALPYGLLPGKMLLRAVPCA
jgi:hypothetical protein